MPELPAPVPITPPAWWHVTATALNGRTAPDGGVRSVRVRGYNFRAAARATGAGRTWLVSTKGTFYAEAYCAPGKAKPAPSPVPGYPSTTPWRKKPNDRTYWQARGYHTGTDWAAPTGATVVALNAGKVVRYQDKVLGTVALLWYRDKLGRKFTRWYCHLSAITRTGAVKAGQEIGRVGHSGTGAAMGPHLHLERRAGWTTSWSGTDLDPTAGWSL